MNAPDKVMAQASDLLGAIAIGDEIGIARSLVALGLGLVPVALLREHLEAGAVERANIAADLAERLKFGGEG